MQYLANVTTLKLDANKCIGCKMCTAVCPHSVFTIESGKARVENRNACMECGACARNCPVGAITVRAGVGCAQGLIRAAFGARGGCCGEGR